MRPRSSRTPAQRVHRQARPGAGAGVDGARRTAFARPERHRRRSATRHRTPRTPGSRPGNGMPAQGEPGSEYRLCGSRLAGDRAPHPPTAPGAGRAGALVPARPPAGGRPSRRTRPADRRPAGVFRPVRGQRESAGNDPRADLHLVRPVTTAGGPDHRPVDGRYRQRAPSTRRRPGTGPSGKGLPRPKHRGEPPARGVSAARLHPRSPLRGHRGTPVSHRCPNRPADTP